LRITAPQARADRPAAAAGDTDDALGEIRTAVRRPRANEGGREEEENRPEIPATETAEPHSRKTWQSSL
jgi:hypothetical protein